MAVNVYQGSDGVVDCEDAVLLPTPMEKCPEEPYASQECVLTEDLAPLLNAYLEHEISEGVESIRKILCARVGVPERRLFGILQQEGSSVSLDLADRLLDAADIAAWEVPVYLVTEVSAAVKIQTELIRTIARSSGRFIPYGYDAKIALPQTRRMMLRGE